MLIDLQEWARGLFKTHCPAKITLQRWARFGLIQPPARLIGRKYFVEVDADYIPLSAQNNKKKMDNVMLARGLAKRAVQGMDR